MDVISEPCRSIPRINRSFACCTKPCVQLEFDTVAPLFPVLRSATSFICWNSMVCGPYSFFRVGFIWFVSRLSKPSGSQKAEAPAGAARVTAPPEERSRTSRANRAPGFQEPPGQRIAASPNSASQKRAQPRSASYIYICVIDLHIHIDTCLSCFLPACFQFPEQTGVPADSPRFRSAPRPLPPPSRFEDDLPPRAPGDAAPNAPRPAASAAGGPNSTHSAWARGASEAFYACWWFVCDVV